MDVLLYTWAACGHCERARELLRARAIPFDEHPLDDNRALKRRLAAQLGRADMPYALIDGELVGGVADIAARLAR